MTAVENPAPAATKMMISIRCTGRISDGRPCNKEICRVDLDHWEEVMDVSKWMEEKCVKCGKTFHLAEYR